jgi:hypothetical protein
MSIVSFMLPYECPDFRICRAYPEFSLLHLIALICSLNLTLKECPVCPIYCKGHSLHFSLYIPGEL